MSYRKNQRVWVEDNENAWLSGTVVDVSDKKIDVRVTSRYAYHSFIYLLHQHQYHQ